VISKETSPKEKEEHVRKVLRSPPGILFPYIPTHKRFNHNFRTIITRSYASKLIIGRKLSANINILARAFNRYVSVSLSTIVIISL
jgi:hypothetical protein